ncbi:hypothetical protein I6E29_02325 [Arcanobacterium haemolyticum]|nr:hypothetical protein [Arcanobacterium haemolyticum]
MTDDPRGTGTSSQPSGVPAYLRESTYDDGVPTLVETSREHGAASSPTMTDTTIPHAPGRAVAEPRAPWQDALQGPLTDIDTDAGRGVRLRLDPIGQWDRVVACATVLDERGEYTNLLAGCAHVFLTPQALASALPEPAAAQVRMTKGRLLTILSESLAEPDFRGVWIYGLPGASKPEYLPVADLAPMEEILATMLTMARTRAGQIPREQALAALAERGFFYKGAWDSSSFSSRDDERGDDVPHDGADTILVDGKHLVPLYLSPVNLMRSGTVGNVATIRLSDCPAILGAADGCVIEPSAAYGIVISRDELPV